MEVRSPLKTMIRNAISSGSRVVRWWIVKGAFRVDRHETPWDGSVSKFTGSGHSYSGMLDMYIKLIEVT
jgi:hypothetical protein